MCRAKSSSGSSAGRRCPCNTPGGRIGMVVRQRISRYARRLDRADTLGDEKEVTRNERLFTRAMQELSQLRETITALTAHPEPPPTRAGEFTITSTVDMSDTQLQQAWAECADDPAARDALSEIFEWRDARDAERDAEIAAETQRQQAAAAAAIAAEDDPSFEGNPVRNPARRPGRHLTTEQRTREEYTFFVHSQFLQAEDDCRGNMLTEEGRRKGIDPVTLFSGNGQAVRAYASDELKAWFHQHGRLSYQAYRYQVLGWETDRKASERARIASYGDVAA